MNFDYIIKSVYVQYFLFYFHSLGQRKGQVQIRIQGLFIYSVELTRSRTDYLNTIDLSVIECRLILYSWCKLTHPLLHNVLLKNCCSKTRDSMQI